MNESKIIYKIFSSLSILLISTFFLTTHAFPKGNKSDFNDNFIEVLLPNGISIDIPRVWGVIGPDFQQHFNTAVEAMLDLSNIKIPSDLQSQNLLIARTVSPDVYASVNVSVYNPDLSSEKVSSMNKSEIRNYESSLKKEIENVIAQTGKSPKWLGLHRELVNNSPSFIYEYVRMGSENKEIFVRALQIYRTKMMVSISLSCRLEEKEFWEFTLSRIESSLKFTK